MKFEIGDKVQEGMRVGTITDVGTQLIQVKSDEGGLRVVCPWELAKIPAEMAVMIEHRTTNLGAERITSGS